MRKTLLAILASAAFVGLIEDPAHSASALWSETKHWTVTGDSETNFCAAETHYPSDGVSINFGFDGDQWVFGIGGTTSPKGKVYNVAFVFDGGKKFHGEFIGIGDGYVAAFGVTDEFMASLAVSYGITIEGFGRYKLIGSADAIKETITCQTTLSEARISQVWTPSPDDTAV